MNHESEFYLTIVTAAIAILFIVSIPFVNYNLKTGSSDMVGQVVKIDRRGVICDSNEVDFRLGGFQSGTGVMGMHPEHFAVKDSSLLEKLQAAKNSNSEVNITVETKFVSSRCSGENGKFITAIN